MLARISSANTQSTMPLRFRAHDRDVHVEIPKSPLDIANIRNAKLVRELLVSLVRPNRYVGIVGDDGQLKSRMRRHSSGDVVVFDGAEHGTAIRWWSRHQRPSTATAHR